MSESILYTRVIDVLGIVHSAWKRNMSRSSWHRSCLNHGPKISTKPVNLPEDTPVTCLWCLRVEYTP